MQNLWQKCKFCIFGNCSHFRCTPQLTEPYGLPGDRCLVPLPSTKPNPVLIQSTRLVLWFIATGINQAQGLSTWPEGGAALARRWCWTTLATEAESASRRIQPSYILLHNDISRYKRSLFTFKWPNAVLLPMYCDIFPDTFVVYLW